MREGRRSGHLTIQYSSDLVRAERLRSFCRDASVSLLGSHLALIPFFSLSYVDRRNIHDYGGREVVMSESSLLLRVSVQVSYNNSDGKKSHIKGYWDA